MAAIIVGPVIQYLGSLIIEEIKSLGTVRQQVESIKNELEIIRPFLRNADEKAAAEELDQGQSNDGIRIWVQQIREQAYRIEDVLDEFTYLVAQLRHGAGLDGVLPRFCHCMKMQKLRYKIAVEIKDIKSSLEEIDKRRKRFDLISIEEGPRNGMGNPDGVRSYFIKEDQIVGNESIRKEFIDWLVDKGTQHRVLAVVGVGGIGKTTLVASVYKRPLARNCFDCYAWIEVGRACNEEDVFRKLLRQLSRSRKEPPPEDIDGMGSRELIDLLRKYLKEKRYMVVFDDVRQADFWKYVEHGLLDNGKANRIFISTRNRDVADYIADFIPGSGDHISVHVLEGLPPEEAWQLFGRKAFPGGVCPHDLEKLSHDILAKCDGLPIAVAALGGLLSKKNKVHEWQELLNNLGSELKRDIHLKDCNSVLCESYNDLPHHLKPCLLYFALFPARYIVECERLIRLWIAEGFVQLQDNKKKLHEEAEAYLTELIHRSVVQVSETSIDGKVISVRVHELMREIIRRNAKQFGFSQELKEQEEQDSSQQSQVRRITVHKGNIKVMESIRDSKVRSVFLFEVDELHSTSICTLAIANFKLMKVLDFQGAHLHDSLPKEVGNLFNLRYLSLRKTKVKVLPKSIGKLFNLDTLDMRHTLVSELPNDIKNLKKLRCLLGGHLDQLDHTHGGGMKIQDAIGSLTELQELAFVEADTKVVQELGRLRKLKKLGLRVTHGKGKDLGPSISNMEDLQSLDVESMDRGEVINLQSIASPPQGLHHLYLTGILKKLPDWISNLQNLVKMRLAGSGLIDDPFEALHSLPNLMELSFIQAYNGEYLHFKEGWFPKLKNLMLVGFKELKSMIIDDGAMPLLQSLQIESSPLLKVPTGISYLKNLIELVLVDMSKEFVDEIVSSEYYFKVFASRIVEGKHITNITNPRLPPEYHQQASKDGGEEKDDKDGENLNDEDNNPPMQPGPLETSKDGNEDKKTIEKHTPLEFVKLPQTSVDEERKNTVEKDYGEPEDDEGKNTTKKDHSSSGPLDSQEGSKDDKEGQNITDKDNNPPMQPELLETSKDDNEGEKNTEKHTSPEFIRLPQTSKDEGGNIIEKDFDEDDEGSKDDKEGGNLTDKKDNPPMQFELPKTSKDDDEDKKNIEKHTPPVLVEPPQTSKGQEGRNIIEKNHAEPEDKEGKDTTKKDHSSPVPLKPQQGSKDDKEGVNLTDKDGEERKEITGKDYSPPVEPERKQPMKEFAKNVAGWQRQSDVPKDGEGRSIIEKDRKLQQPSKDNEEGKEATKTDHSPPIQRELKVNEFLRRIATRKPHHDVTKS